MNDSQANGVPELHFRFWNRVEPEVRDQYLAQFRADPEAMCWVRGRLVRAVDGAKDSS